MRLVLDVENSITWRDGKTFIDPYEVGNHLVQVGMVNADNKEEIMLVTLDHNEHKDSDGLGRALVQNLLDKTTLLIMHNAKHDLMWLWASGFKYDGDIYDTMLAEYILCRGQKPKEGIGLSACAIRRGLAEQKEDYLTACIKKGINTHETDLDSLSVYLRADILTTCELFHSIEADYATPESRSLYAVRTVTFQTCKTLTEMYMSGLKVDLDVLEQVKEEFELEQAQIEERLQIKVRDLMGDTPINLNSPEQLSQVIFSRKPNDKKEWADLFEFVKDKAEFKAAVNANSKMLFKTTAFTCPTCNGAGHTYKTKKDGTRYARPNKCTTCDSRGYGLKESKQMAGLGFSAPNKKWIAHSGFGTGKDNLDVLVATARNNNMEDAASFILDVKRLNAITSYLSSFVSGISVHTKSNGYLHATLSQHITATGRFSSKNPNMQNMPRGGTFPVKKVFVSRWEGGKILEADFAQLEFRAAAFLAQDEVAMREVETGFDVHAYTAKVISDAGQPTARQAAKEHTFAPLFGATGYGRSNAEKAYYEHFNEKYKGIAQWQQNLADEAMRFNKITNISGRQYAFPDIERRANGSVTHFTMLKNYPVQGFATGDVTPAVLNEFHKRLKPLKSVLINTVHDSAVADIHPDEEEEVLQIVADLNDNLVDLIEDVYKVRMNVPLLLEAKIGPNWLDTKDV